MIPKEIALPELLSEKILQQTELHHQAKKKFEASNKKPHYHLNGGVKISSTFDNCFFHCYSTYLLANNFALPNDLFSFESIIGPNSPARKLQLLFPNLKSLDLFAHYTELTKALVLDPNFILEKTLVLGVLFREWFATQLEKNHDYRENLLNLMVLDRFNTYKELKQQNRMRPISADETLLLANKKFLDYLAIRPKSTPLSAEQQHFETYFSEAQNDEQMAISTYWRNEGYLQYCKHIASLGHKMAPADFFPVLASLNQPTTLSLSTGQIIDKIVLPTDKAPLEIKLDNAGAHYSLLKTPATSDILDQFQQSFDQYTIDRDTVFNAVGNKISAANSTPSLLVAALCPPYRITVSPFQALIDKIEQLKRVVANPALAKRSFINPISSVSDDLFIYSPISERTPPVSPQTSISRSSNNLEEPPLFQITLANDPIERGSEEYKKRQQAILAHHKNAEKIFLEELAKLKAKEKEFFNDRGKYKAYRAAQRLYLDLKIAGNLYFQSYEIPTMSQYQAFKRSCTRALNVGRGELEKHRGWKQILGNLAIAILTAGIGWVIAVAINKGFFFSKTDSAKILDRIEQSTICAEPLPLL